jgi:hypothetical protein
MPPTCGKSECHARENESRNAACFEDARKPPRRHAACREMEFFELEAELLRLSVRTKDELL